MNSHKNSQHQEPIESDPVWDLLAQSPGRQAGARFADDVVRQARLDAASPGPLGAWWRRVFSPVPAFAVGGMAAAAMLAVFLGLSVWNDGVGDPPDAVVLDAAEQEERLAHLQEVLETEMLFAAMEHLDEFSDAELVSLIGF